MLCCTLFYDGLSVLLARGCSCDDAQQPDIVRVARIADGIGGGGGALSVSTTALDDGSLLQTLTKCVVQLESQPLSINMKSEIEKAQSQVAAEHEEMIAMIAMETTVNDV